MAKRPDNDATMDVSMSQLVPDAPGRPRAPNAPPQGRGPRAPVPQHDMSVWKQVVVGSDDFAPPPKARSGGRRRWILAGALGAAVVGSGAAVAMYKLGGDAPAASAPASAGEAGRPAAAVAASSAPAPAEQAAPAARSTDAPPAEPAAAAAEPTWIAGLASILATEVAAMSWFDALAGHVELAMAADAAPAKKGGKRTAAAPKKGAATPKKKPAARR